MLASPVAKPPKIFESIPEELYGNINSDCSICLEGYSLPQKQIEQTVSETSSTAQKENEQNKVDNSQKAASLKAVVTACNHVFHDACIMNSYSFKKTCPICRRDLVWLKETSKPAFLTSAPASPNQPERIVAEKGLFNRLQTYESPFLGRIQRFSSKIHYEYVSPLVWRVQNLQYEICLEHIVAGALSTIPYIAINTIFNGLRIENLARQFVVSSLQGSYVGFVTIVDTINSLGVADASYIMGGLQLGCNTLGLMVEGFSYLTTVSTQVTKAALWVFAGAYFAGKDVAIEKIPHKLTVLIFITAGYEFAWGQDFQTAVVRSLGHVATFSIGAVSCHAIRLIAKQLQVYTKKLKYELELAI